MKIIEIIVVEGRDDSAKVRQAVEADTLETNGSAINQKTLQKIKHAKAKRGVIIFTDPDYPGERIRHLIDQHIPGCKHAFLPKEKARAKHPNNKSLGIEHASINDIQEALAAVYELTSIKNNEISRKDLLQFGLIGKKNSNSRRAKLGDSLQIGKTNGKQLLKRLTMFQITKKQFEQAMIDILEGENDEF